MEDRGGDTVVGGEFFDLRGGSLDDDVAWDEAGGVGAVLLVEGVDGGLGFGAGHIFAGNLCVLALVQPGLGLQGA